MSDACDRFTPFDPDVQPRSYERCERCRQPKAQHEMPHCRSRAIVKGVLYQCKRRHPHDGEPHGDGEASWGCVEEK